MLQQLLWAEVIVKASIGILLLVMPSQTVAVSGMPASESGFWPRLVAALLLGIAAAILVQGSFPSVRVIAPAGLIAINLAGAAVLVGLQTLGRGAQTRRGSILLWVIAAGLVLISLFEISYI